MDDQFPVSFAEVIQAGAVEHLLDAYPAGIVGRKVLADMRPQVRQLTVQVLKRRPPEQSRFGGIEIAHRALYDCPVPRIPPVGIVFCRNSGLLEVFPDGRFQGLIRKAC
ncbi:hypothetical protein ACFQ36_02700 [Arthrobacter sp. GCM10027362]|uniref:hypothetical protein n=1 Tax=Arthrobacter sp. GCM10027362 TaxID=3273379 RepID=UPI003636F004